MPKTVLPEAVEQCFDATNGQLNVRERVMQFQEKSPERSFGGLQQIIENLRAIREEIVSLTSKLEEEDAARRERQQHESWQHMESRYTGIPLDGDRS